MVCINKVHIEYSCRTEGGEKPVRVHVDPDLCISCGSCVDICPDVFDWNEDGIAEEQVDEVPEDLEDLAREAVESCPTDAIMDDTGYKRQDSLAMKNE